MGMETDKQKTICFVIDKLKAFTQKRKCEVTQFCFVRLLLAGTIFRGELMLPSFLKNKEQDNRLHAKKQDKKHKSFSSKKKVSEQTLKALLQTLSKDILWVLSLFYLSFFESKTFFFRKTKLVRTLLQAQCYLFKQALAKPFYSLPKTA